MSEQSDQVVADVQALQAASQAAADHIGVLTDHVTSGTPITDEQFDNLHNALVSVTDQLNQAVADSQAELGNP